MSNHGKYWKDSKYGKKESDSPLSIALCIKILALYPYIEIKQQ